VLVFGSVTGLDWLIIVFVLAMGVWGYQQGLLVGALSLAGFALGAFAGSRLGPALLADGSESPYAPVTALAGALLIGGIAAVSLEGVARALRARVLRRGPAVIVDAAGGALLLAALGLALAWLFGAAALNTPGAKDLRQAVQRSAILRTLNDTFPPSGDLLNILNRIDPRVAIEGPSPGVGAPDSRLARDPDVVGDEDSVVKVLGTACGLGVEGSGWVAVPGLVVTNAHVIAGQEDTTVTPSGGSPLDATPVHFDPTNDLALLRVGSLDSPALPLVPDPASGTPGAVLGYPENASFTISPARLGATGTVISEDAYGRGPVSRRMTALRGEVRSGNSGGPMVDGAGDVLTTVFAATSGGGPGGYGVPNEIVRDALSAAGGEVGTGPCAR
jgi:S1-C subfamily serine protease